MSYKPIMNDYWTESTIERASRVGQKVYKRAMQRKVEWPHNPQYRDGPVQDPEEYTSLDDAFASVVQFMSTTSRQCNRYYKSCPRSSVSAEDGQHCDRFHTPEYAHVRQRNPLMRSENVHVVVQPGNYAVTAGVWGKTTSQTHVVNVKDGSTVDVDFVL